jgi:hypothetical protein
MPEKMLTLSLFKGPKVGSTVIGLYTFLPVTTFFINGTQYSNFRVPNSLSQWNFIHILISHFEALSLIILHYMFQPKWPSSGVYNCR